MDSQEFLDLVRASRTVRRFDETRPLTEAELEGLIEAARFAPTGNNTQLLRFHPAASPEERSLVFSHLHWAAALPEWDGPAPGERPGGYIVVLAPAGAQDSPIRCLDAGIAAQTLMLAARAAGWGGCILKSVDAVLADELGFAEEGYAVSLVLAFGIPAEEVFIEPPTTSHGLRYWHGEGRSQHVPKLALDDLVV